MVILWYAYSGESKGVFKMNKKGYIDTEQVLGLIYVVGLLVAVIVLAVIL